MKRVRAAFRLFVLLAIAMVVVGIWRPDWRAVAIRDATPVLKRAAAPLLERVQAWRGERRLAIRPAPLSQPGREDGVGPTRTAPRRDDTNGPSDDDTTQRLKGGEETSIAPSGNLPARLPALRPAPPLPGLLRSLQTAATANPTAAGFRRLADTAAAAGFPDIAAEAYTKEARIYRRLGDVNAAVVEELKAGRYHAEGRIYLHAAEAPPLSLDTHQRLEPPYGTLLGAFIDRDDQLDHRYTDENWQTHRDEGEFEQLTGKKHASLFCYLQYGKPFPFRWAERLRDADIIPHLAWEPRSLADVRDDAYLRRFADAVARLDAPIFIRFAGEMNGEWTSYHGDPALYREKFRLVYRVLTRRARKAAMIWCVNSIPAAGIDAYYPGDDAVDWVGLNLYNVLFFDNDRRRPAEGVHPVDLLRPIYERYAAHKPIALCEYAASHQAAVDPRPRPEFAIARMSQLYDALPRLFPRVKLIDWFDCNNLRYARPDRQLNNYSLTDDPKILRAYRKAIAPDYYLDALEDRPRETIRALRSGEPLSGVVPLSGWVRCHLDRPRVYLTADDQVLYAGDELGSPTCFWDTRRVRPGPHEIRLLVVDNTGRRILEERRRVQVTANL